MEKAGYILEMRNITKTFPGVKALDDVTFKVKAGEVHCLIGANGAGKSTLMKILSAVYSEDSGEICFDSKILPSQGTQKRRNEGIAVIYQELSLFNELTVAENVYVNNYPKFKNGAIDWKKVCRDTQNLADSLNLKINAKDTVSSLNIGQRQLTEIMKALACDAKLIVMDEPSSALSQSEYKILVKVISDLKKKGITIIYISHHLEELFEVGDRITILRDGKFIACQEAGKLNEDNLVEYMTGIDLTQIHTEETQVHPVSDEVVLELKDMCNGINQDINLKLHKGEILGLYGLVGSGRSEILESVFGTRSIREGSLMLHGKAADIKNTHNAIRHKIGLAPENRKDQGLVLSLSVWENMSMVSLPRFAKKGRICYKDINAECEAHKTRLNIKTPSINTVIRNLSGGNQQKVILSKWLMQDCKILLLDEPTQGIDVMAKEEIYKLIREISELGKSLIIVSSELQELLRVCDNIHILYDGRQVLKINKSNYNQEQILHASVSGRAI